MLESHRYGLVLLTILCIPVQMQRVLDLVKILGCGDFWSNKEELESLHLIVNDPFIVSLLNYIAFKHNHLYLRIYNF